MARKLHEIKLAIMNDEHAKANINHAEVILHSMLMVIAKLLGLKNENLSRDFLTTLILDV